MTNMGKAMVSYFPDCRLAVQILYGRLSDTSVAEVGTVGVTSKVRSAIFCPVVSVFCTNTKIAEGVVCDYIASGSLSELERNTLLSR